MNFEVDKGVSLDEKNLNLDRVVKEENRATEGKARQTNRQRTKHKK